MKRSLVQTGSSLAVTLPIDVVQAFGLRKGQDVDLTVHPITGAITIRPGHGLAGWRAVSADFRALADEVLERRAGCSRSAGMIRHLSVEQILSLHQSIVGHLSDAGVRNLSALESAVSRPAATFDGEDLHPTLEAKAAALRVGPDPRRAVRRRAVAKPRSSRASVS